jgi:hypothetical protein
MPGIRQVNNNSNTSTNENSLPPALGRGRINIDDE